MGVKGAKVPLRKVGTDSPLTETFLRHKKEISVPPDLEKKEGLSLWNVGETPGDENASAMMEYPRYSRRKRIDEPGSPVPEGGVVHPFSTESLRRRRSAAGVGRNVQ